MRDGGRIAAAIDVLSDVIGRHQPVKVAARDWGKTRTLCGLKRSRLGVWLGAGCSAKT